MNTNKRVVRFNEFKVYPGEEFYREHREAGYPTIVLPIDHPDKENVSNKVPVLTSKVVAITEDGFETENTLYIRCGS